MYRPAKELLSRLFAANHYLQWPPGLRGFASHLLHLLPNGIRPNSRQINYQALHPEGVSSWRKPDTLDDTTPLITGGVLDSIATVKLIAFLEEEYGVQIEPHEMNADYLNFLPDIASLVEERQSAK